MQPDRKITGAKFTITLPKPWRDSHDLQPGMFLTPFFESGSPLILIPKGVELSAVELKMIEFLTKYPTMKEAQEVGTALEEIVSQIS